MENLRIEKAIIQRDDYRKFKDTVALTLVDTVMILSGGAFQEFRQLTDVYFGLDITRIGNSTFANCTSLRDVWFAITDKNKIIEIADDAFRGCKDITFHIFASARDNPCLNSYAKKHGFRVTSMI